MSNRRKKRAQNKITLPDIATILGLMSVFAVMGVCEHSKQIKKTKVKENDIHQPVIEFKTHQEMKQTQTTGYRVIRLNQKQYDLLQKALNAERQKQR